MIIEILRQLTGLAVDDTSKDAAIMRVWNRVLDEADKRLGRGLQQKVREEKFYWPESRQILLSSYPIVEVYDINGSGIQALDHVHYRYGIVYFSRFSDYYGEAVIRYLGGYSFEPTDLHPMPEDLKAVLFEAFQFLWLNANQTTGLPGQGSGGGVVPGSGDVSRLTLADFGSISFDVASQVVSESSQNLGTKVLLTWGWLAPWASLLQQYRSEKAPGTAFA